ncbi:MAG: (2Fe-2S)-binding protein, partial [Thaumarchaeota archaeon]|nr:(2Fe-2S)-binding protein [Nitrososphaerota archaeon]
MHKPEPAGRREVSITTIVNGNKISCRAPSNYTLAELLREKLNLTGTKLGCNRAECGVCTVLLDSVPVFSCTTLAVEANDRNVETVEGLANDGRLHPLQRAFVEQDALQCGFCTPGLLMSLKALFDRERRPSMGQVKDAIAGNYCRCGAYQHMF